MKQRDFKAMALLGLAGGLMLTSKASGNTDSSPDYFLASATQKAKCPGKNGCPGKLTADRDKNSSQQPPSTKDDYDPNDSNMGYHLFTEDELLLELNDEGTRMYESLSPEGKQLVLKVASMRCAKTNPCGGLNACTTDKNDCAGQGKCQGQGKCAVSDKNLAVRLVYQKMNNKRANALQQK
jgi:hypothetical protein